MCAAATLSVVYSRAVRRLHVQPIRRPVFAARLLQRASFNSSTCGGSGSSGSKSAALPEVAGGAETADASSTSHSSASSTQPVVAKQDVTKTSTIQPAASAPAGGVESIEDILARSRRNEIIDRVGPQVERYMPTEDPTAFLLPDSRLEPSERRWQKVFVALPYAVFVAMLAAPFLLVRMNLPLLRQRAEEDRQIVESRKSEGVAAHVPEFAVVNFGQMPDVLERPCPTLLLLYDPSTLASKVMLPAFRDISLLLRAAKVPTSVAALDLSAAPSPPDTFYWEYPRALAPHIQLVLPRARDGEAGIVDYDGRWSAGALAEAARKMAGPMAPSVPEEELALLEVRTEQLRDALFELVFLEDGSPQEATGVRPRASSPLWQWLFGRRQTPKPCHPAIAEGHIRAAEHRINLSGGLDAAIASCHVEVKRLTGNGGNASGDETH